jgi:hypothetical protein
MQGNCSAAPPAVPAPALRPLRPGQCVILTDGSFTVLSSSGLGQRLLLQNLYLRAASQAALLPQASYLMDVSGDDVSVWLEGVTFQGTARRDQDGAWMGLLVLGLGMARIHAEGAPSCCCFKDCISGSQHDTG